MRFRRSALIKREDPEQLDVPIRLTRPRTWIAVATLFAVVVGVVAWAFVGSLPVKVRALGVLTYPAGSFAVQTLSTGEVVDVLVKPGDALSRGELVARLAVYDDAGRLLNELPVKARSAGRAVRVEAQVGQVVRAGETLVVAERSGAGGDELVAALFVPPSSSHLIAPGASVDLAVDSAPAGSFGVMRGRVLSVDRFPASYPQVVAFLGDEEQARRITGGGSARKVVVELLRAETASGYAWSTHAGPPFQVESRTGVVGGVRQLGVRPIDWVLP